MDTIVQHGSSEYFWQGLEDPTHFRPPFSGQPFVCLLWDARGGWSRQQRDALTSSLLDADCRYVVSGGVGCESWHDELDESLAAREALGGSASFVGTTWHDGEPPEAVAEFFVLHAQPPTEPVSRFLVLQLGLNWDLQCELMMWVRGWVVHPYGEDAPAPTNQLRRFWFPLTRGFGVGVTAHSESEARELAEKTRLLIRPDAAFTGVIPDVDVSTLDQGHVMTNAGPTVVRGVWYPFMNL